jgi:nucleoside-diphosphate-sugar epimerase
VWSDESYNQIWNVGSNLANLSKEDVIDLIKKQIPVDIEYKDLSFGGDMRDITVSFDKIFNAHAFSPTIKVEQGIAEVSSAIKCGIIKNPMDDKYRNAKFIVS